MKLPCQSVYSLGLNCSPTPPDPTGHTIPNYCTAKAQGTLDAYLAEWPDEVAAAEAFIQANCPPPLDYCAWEWDQMAAYVDEHPEMADEVLAHLEAECCDCPSINWLRGFISSRDPGYVTPY
ncbi:MAG: hypothetical protein MUP76_11200 [Acidimicrobiia bacterium]|nr:hypothetical protein [Acidimicrobiia bacterium]